MMKKYLAEFIAFLPSLSCCETLLPIFFSPRLLKRIRPGKVDNETGFSNHGFHADSAPVTGVSHPDPQAFHFLATLRRLRRKEPAKLERAAAIETKASVPVLNC